MEYAALTVGVHFNEFGEPLLTADGRIVGTLNQVKATIIEVEARLASQAVNILTVTSLNAALDERDQRWRADLPEMIRKLQRDRLI